MNKPEFISAVKKLGLSEEDYIVIGSGILCALDIRQADDIDIVVSESVFNKFLDNKQWTRNSFEDGTLVLTNGTYEVGVDRKIQNAKPTLKDLKKDQAVINGVPFISLKRVMGLKLERGWAKDLVDVELIQSYLHSKTL